MSSARQSLYWFEPVYDINLLELEIFQSFYKENQEFQNKTKKEKDLQISNLMKATVNMKISNSGQVSLVLCHHDLKNIDDNNVVLYVCRILDNGNKIKNFTTDLSFDSDSKQQILKSIDQKIQMVTNFKRKEEINQKYLPKNFRDPKKTKAFIKQINALEQSKVNVVEAFVLNGDLLLIKCGRDVKFGQLKDEMYEDKDQDEVKEKEENSVDLMNLFDDEEEEEEPFKDMNFKFEEGTQIHKIWNTSERDENHIQIIAKHDQSNTMIVITWDCSRNIEASMFQYKCEPDTRPENYVVKGMNQKYNYFVNEHQIFDLEFNIPQ